MEADDGEVVTPRSCLVLGTEIVAELALGWCGAAEVARFGRASRGAFQAAATAARRMCSLELASGRRRVDQRASDGDHFALRALGCVEVRQANGGLETVVAVSSHVIVAAKRGTRLYSAGKGRSGQRGVRSVHDSTVLEPLRDSSLVTDAEPVGDVACGAAFSVFVAGAGVAYGCGDGKSGALGSCCAPCSSCGTPRPIPELARTRVWAIAAGGAHSFFVVNSDRHLLALGANDHGQLGVGDRHPTKTPRPVIVNDDDQEERRRPMRDVAAVAAGSNHSLACDAGGALYSWGAARRGQLGHADRRARLSAARLAYFSAQGATSGIHNVACGDGTSFALDGDGALHACGDAKCGVLGLGPAETTGNTTVPTFRRVRGALSNRHVTSFAAGFAHAIAADAQGHVFTWGGPSYRHLLAQGRGDTYDQAASETPAPAPLPAGAFAVRVAAGGSLHDPFASTSLVVTRAGVVLCSGGGSLAHAGSDGTFAPLYDPATFEDDRDGEARRRYDLYGVF